jgi:hypothetical protein
MVIRGFRTQIINLLKETLPPYTKKAEREEIIEFQKYTNPTHLVLYGQVQELRRTLITQLNTI